MNSERVAVSWELTVLRILAFLERTELRTVAFLGRFNGLGNFVQLQSHISNEFGHRKLVFIIACQNVHFVHFSVAWVSIHVTRPQVSRHCNGVTVTRHDTHNVVLLFRRLFLGASQF